ncbi:hypothetical protein B0J13DRAFT_22111 [Dactylonectria estremocensis]|uniref:Uncharacterized protein n=1 Tax=Dactylonectria estremocensis TaxID=1079267 RepID=A0A9P9FHJ8_9HYPO|nr:hypothetical protein B0J13DRAFT_22111 [Dactylonectria estremocensis]
MGSYTHSLDGMELGPPENASLYRNRTLPVPPGPPTIPSRSPARSVKSLNIFPSVVGPGNSVENLPPMALPLSLPGRSTTSLPDSPCSDHRASFKAQQLMGPNVALCFDWSPTRGFSPVASPVLIRDDSSSTYSHSVSESVLEDDLADTSKCSMPPLLEDDIDGTTSNRSSACPKSPLPLMHSASSIKRASSIYSNPPSILEPVADIDDDQFDTDSDSWLMSQSHSHFSDTETADEYHRITSNLAVLDKQQRGRNQRPDPARSRSLTSRLSGTAKSLFHRRREPPRSVSSAHGSFAGGDRPDRLSLGPGQLHPQDATSTPPRSVFETSDDESEVEEGPVREVLHNLFSRRDERGASEATSPIPRSVPQHHAELLMDTSPKIRSISKDAHNNTNTMQMNKPERRQHQLRTQIKIIPEEHIPR